MTLVTLASFKGAPGVTTLACLLGGTWPESRRVVVVERDPAGGSLSARFGLSATRGWHSLATAARRPGTELSLDDHLQQLPGGLDVLVAPSGGAHASWSAASEDRVERLLREEATDRDLIVDVGRAPSDEVGLAGMLRRSDHFCIVVGADGASALNLHARAGALNELGSDRIGLVVVGRGPYRAREIERLASIPVLAEVPYDPDAAAVLTDGTGSPRRLARSALVAAASRLAGDLAGTTERVPAHPGASDSLPSAGSPELRDRPSRRPEAPSAGEPARSGLVSASGGDA